ncbi:MAG: sorbosone dehydrogenase family protein [Ferruginibacter sp.]
MKNISFNSFVTAVFISIIFFSCTESKQKEEEKKEEAKLLTPADTVKDKVETVNLPEPYATKSVINFSKVIGWPAGKMPVAPAGFTVSKFADSLDNPRWIYVADNGDVFIAESNSPHSAVEKITGKNKSADRITLLRDANNDGIPELRSVFLKGLNKPFGMLTINNNFYVANTDGIMLYPYTAGAISISDKGREIVKLPGGPRHWTRNIISNDKKDKIYIAVGSSSNVAEDGMEKEIRRADILEVNTDGSNEIVYASGLRNPVGMAWAPGTNTLWTAVNERDELGDELVPDYMTSVKQGGFYGWPYCYFGQHLDPRLKDKDDPQMVAKTIVPDVALGSHTASLGLAFYTGTSFPQTYRNAAFIGQHGSWNKSTFTGYKVVFIPFSNGKPTGRMQDFLTGFIADENKKEVYGRPVGVAVLKDGSLLVADDAGNCLWRVSASK